MNLSFKCRIAAALLCLGTAFIMGCATPQSADSVKLVTEDFMVPAVDPGIQLYVRNKRPEGMSQFTQDNIVLFVHGATYPAETSFDLKLNGISWMEYIANRGYDVYLVDVRGFGRSSRPPEMDQPAKNNAPIVGTNVAARDVGAAVDFIRKRRNVEKINLLAWSWGTRIMPTYTAGNNEKVNKLVLYAPSWVRSTKSLTDTGDSTLGAYRTVTVEAAKKRKGFGVPPEKQKDLMPESWFDAWADATFASDPWGAQQKPPVVRAPNGSAQESRDMAVSGKPPYDAAAIRVPTLLVVAEWDSDTPTYMAQTLFPQLVNAPYKRFVTIGEGTHSVIMEKNRMQLFREVQLFLDESIAAK
ncbi:MAG: alpha/beta hydrolase [Betaproteobacteria bacterium]|nr:alpha/beta hydrolase [Betaproteobacteria bacterium]